MKKNERKFLILTSLLFVSTFNIVSAVCGCAPIPVVDSPKQTNGGGFAFASFGNGAAFTWSDYVAPVVNIVTNGTSTTVTTTAGYFKNNGQVAGASKFMFKNNMGMGSVRQPDLEELVKILKAENLLVQSFTVTSYNAAVRDAVSAFQKHHGIKPAPQYPYGYFGPITRNHINTNY